MRIASPPYVTSDFMRQYVHVSSKVYVFRPMLQLLVWRGAQLGTASMLRTISL